jgi:hypothetical protein
MLLDYAPKRGAPGWVALAMAMLPTLLLLGLLSRPPSLGMPGRVHSPTKEMAVPVAYLVLPVAPAVDRAIKRPTPAAPLTTSPAASTTDEATQRPPRSAPSRARTTASPDYRAPPLLPITVPIEKDGSSLPPQEPAAPLATPANSASQGLKLTPEVLSHAARDGMSRRRASPPSVGGDAVDAPVSGDDRLARSVESALKPDCLSSNSGGSLLSPVLILAAKLADKCK